MATSSAPAAAPAPAPRLVNLATNDEEAAAAAAAAEAAAAPASDIIIKAPDDIASKLEKEREVHRKRAERFGTEFHEPSKHKILSRTEVKLLESGGPKASGFVRGIDTASEREAARRAARAKRFASSMVNDTVIRERHAGRTAADKELDEMARKRAARFGIAVLSDKAKAERAAQALGTEWTVSDQPDITPTIRENVIHVRAAKYLCASNADLENFFDQYGIAFVEWLNGQSLNVMFSETGSAKRALAQLTEEIPKVDGVTPVHDQWRLCVKPLEKVRTDRYGNKGSTTIIYLRYATDRDTKELAKRTKGASHYVGSTPLRIVKRQRAKRQRAREAIGTEELERRAQERQAQRLADLDAQLENHKLKAQTWGDKTPLKAPLVVADNGTSDTASAAAASSSSSAGDKGGDEDGNTRPKKRGRGQFAFARREAIDETMLAEMTAVPPSPPPMTAEERKAQRVAELDSALEEMQRRRGQNGGGGAGGGAGAGAGAGAVDADADVDVDAVKDEPATADAHAVKEEPAAAAAAADAPAAAPAADDDDGDLPEIDADLLGMLDSKRSSLA